MNISSHFHLNTIFQNLSFSGETENWKMFVRGKMWIFRTIFTEYTNFTHFKILKPRVFLSKVDIFRKMDISDNFHPHSKSYFYWRHQFCQFQNCHFYQKWFFFEIFLAKTIFLTIFSLCETFLKSNSQMGYEKRG